MSSISRKIVSNTLSQMLGKVGTAGLGLIISAILARYLGPEGMGTFTFVLVFVTLFGTLGDWGLSLITVRESSKNPEAASEIIGNVLVIRTLLATVAAVLSVVTIHLLPYGADIRFYVSLASLYLIALSIKTSFQIVFQVHLKMHNSALSEISANVVILTLLVVLVYFQAGLTSILLAYLIGDIAAAAVAATLAYRIVRLKFSLVRDTTKALLLESLPMGAILAVFTIYNRVDTIILSMYKGQAAVGYYAVAYRIYEVLVLGAAYFANAILPVISTLAHDDKAKLREFYKRSFIVLFALGTGVAIINFVLAPLAIWLTAGEAFMASVIPLQILSLAMVVSYFNHLNGYTIIALGKQWYSFLIACLALLFNLILNFLLIPTFSYNGAAVITFFTEAVIVILSVIALSRFLKGSVVPSPREAILFVKEVISKKGKVFDLHD